MQGLDGRSMDRYGRASFGKLVIMTWLDWDSVDLEGSSTILRTFFNLDLEMVKVIRMSKSF